MSGTLNEMIIKRLYRVKLFGKYVTIFNREIKLNKNSRDWVINKILPPKKYYTLWEICDMYDVSSDSILFSRGVVYECTFQHKEMLEGWTKKKPKRGEVLVISILRRPSGFLPDTVRISLLMEVGSQSGVFYYKSLDKLT